MYSQEAQERRDEILDVADKLFRTKGFDNTSISDILSEVGIARGTLYYHFKSKLEIMDSIIDRKSSAMIEQAKVIARDRSIPVLERFFLTIQSLNMRNQGDSSMIEFIHEPQNALINEKNQKIIIKEIPPILLEIVEDGIQEGIFKLDYPYEAIEMVLVYANTVFGNEFSLLSPQEQQKKLLGFLRNLEVLFGANKGTFDSVLQSVLGQS